MKARVDAGSDAARIGAWDATRNDQPLGASDEPASVLEADAADGHVFVLHTGADGGGKIDVYVDEIIPPDVVETLRAAPGSFLVSVPSGRLMVGGAEDHRSGEPSQTSDKSVVSVQPGDYELRCYTPKDTEREPGSEAELRKRVGADEVAYYDRMNRIGCIGGVALLALFPILLFPFGVLVALIVTGVAFLGFFPLRQLVLKRNERYQRLDKVIVGYRLANEDPYLVFELRRVADRSGLRGGTATL